jgi:hypothetical protein
MDDQERLLLLKMLGTVRQGTTGPVRLLLTDGTSIEVSGLAVTRPEPKA